jgi:hypothetical protein
MRTVTARLTCAGMRVWSMQARREGGRRERNEDLPPPPSGGGGGSKDEMTVDQTNAMRAKLGLAPLKK